MFSPPYHFSVDDVFPAILRASQNSAGLFANDFFSFLQSLHKRFGMDVDLYLFQHHHLDGQMYALSDVSDRLLPDFQDCRWIRFGPHAVDRDTPPYAQMPEAQEAFCAESYAEIARFAGEDRTSRWVRLHYFSESFELASFFRSHKVEALLTTDKPAISYRLPSAETDQLRQGRAEYQGMNFVRSHIRVESLVPYDRLQLDTTLQKLCANTSCPVVFTHEYELERAEVRDMTFRVLSWCHERFG